MKFAVHVSAPPSHEMAWDAWRFTQAALKAGHEVVRVFFAGAGVLHGQRLITPGRDETSMTQRWQQLAETHALELVLCVSACLKYGVLDEHHAARWEQSALSLAHGFVISGLGQWSEALTLADRSVSFPV